MKILFILTVLISIGLAYGNDERVNEGASTSTQGDDDDLERCLKCELKRRANNFVLLMVAQDADGEDLIHMMSHRFEQLQAYHDALFTYVLQLEGDVELRSRQRTARVRYFYSKVEQYLLEVLKQACTNHHSYRNFYRYNHNEGMYEIRENMIFGPGECLCFNNIRERTSLSLTPRLPLPRPFENRFSLVTDNGRLSIDEFTVYHIIPLPLLSRFFRLWLADESYMGSYQNAYNQCTSTLIGRMRRSMQKILLYYMRKSKAYSPQPAPAESNDFSFSNETLTIENLRNSHNFLSGNMFVGPVERGPFDPSFRRSGDQLLQAFEYHVAPLIGQRRFLEITSLYRRILKYVQNTAVMSPFERLNIGFRIFVRMSSFFFQHQMTSFNVNQWEYRTVPRPPVPDHTTARSPFNLDDLNVPEKYWVIIPKRRPRSIHKYEYKLLEQHENTTKAELEYRWSEFISDATSIYLESYSRDESLDWSCNFTLLFSEYIDMSPLVPDLNQACPICYSFDEFLYSKIEKTSYWRTCNFDNQKTNVTKWCAAWHRIMHSMSDEDYYLENDQTSTSVSRWKSLSKKDIGTIVTWLTSPNEMNDEEEKIKYNFFTLPEISFKKKTSSVDAGLCLFTTFIPSLLSMRWRDCVKKMG